MNTATVQTTPMPSDLVSSSSARITVRLTRAARSHDTPKRGNTGHARAGPVRRVQPDVIRLVERGLLTDDSARRRIRPSMHTKPRTTHVVPRQLYAPDDAVDCNAQLPDERDWRAPSYFSSVLKPSPSIAAA